MKIKQIKIENFRGIKSFEWTINNSINCLIGPGDSTKTTILDAIEYTLAPRWNINFDDSDFHLCDINRPITIIVTVGQLPDRLLSEQKFGLLIREWNSKDGLHDEPLEKDELVLSIRLTVNKSLEPEWTVFNERDKEGKRISYRDREIIGVSRLGSQIDRHLSWGRGSVLSHLLPDCDDISILISEANRLARNSAKLDKLDIFTQIIARAKEAAQLLGFKPKSEFLPALDPKSINIGYSAITIHDGNIPLRLAGLGSRRLLALGLQLLCLRDGSIVLIDEIESALEPHRIIRLLYEFQKLVEKDRSSAGQVFMTSHSPIVIAELGAKRISIVRTINGATKIVKVIEDLQSTIRDVPEALLGRKIIVCEGKTEYGICRSFETYLIEKEKLLPFANYGVVPIVGGGDKAIIRAKELKSLGYKTSLLIDSDKLDKLKYNITDLEKEGIEVIYWADRLTIEERIANDLPFKSLQEVVTLASKNHGKESVFGKICSDLKISQNEVGEDINEWLKHGIDQNFIRTVLGKSAKNKSWFKRIDYGIELGNLIMKEMPKIQNKDLALKLNKLKKWIYD